MKRGRKTNASKKLPVRTTVTIRLSPHAKEGIDTLCGCNGLSFSKNTELLVLKGLEKVRVKQ